MIIPNKRLSSPPSPSYPPKIIKPSIQTKIPQLLSLPSLPVLSSPPSSFLLNPTSPSTSPTQSNISPPSTLSPHLPLPLLPNFPFNLYETSENKGFSMKRIDLKQILGQSQKMTIFLIPFLFKPEIQQYLKEILQMDGNHLKAICCLDSGGVINEIVKGNESKGKTLKRSR